MTDTKPATDDDMSDAEKIRDLAHELASRHDGAWAFELLRVAMFREAYDSGFSLKLRVSRTGAKQRAAIVPLRKKPSRERAQGLPKELK
jgi:hypothetical protein